MHDINNNMKKEKLVNLTKTQSFHDTGTQKSITDYLD